MISKEVYEQLINLQLTFIIIFYGFIQVNKFKHAYTSYYSFKQHLHINKYDSKNPHHKHKI